MDKENWGRLVQMSHYTNYRAFSYYFHMYFIAYNVFTLFFDCNICVCELRFKMKYITLSTYMHGHRKHMTCNHKIRASMSK
jgi:hypothetical protein